MTDEESTIPPDNLVYLDPMQPAREAIERQAADLARRHGKPGADDPLPDGKPLKNINCGTILLMLANEREHGVPLRSHTELLARVSMNTERRGREGDVQMHSVTLFPGDTAIVNGAELTVSGTVTLNSETPITRVAAVGLTDLPETPLRIDQLWARQGHRVPMTTRQDLRCPCGSAYVRRSETHHSCQYCKRVWSNQSIETQQ